ncbi:MAG: hypothetical protein K2W92_07035 [Alphaproteobacteria bacterium]|nr:hypothetical protein [Alphaproteobacteria bacterium]
MFLSKLFVNIALLFILCISSSILHADRISITNIDAVVDHVRTLRASGVNAQNIGIILDCHGVVTVEEGHSTSHTLKGNIREALTYFQEEEIPFVIATAWNKLDDVVEHAIVATGLGHFFGVTPDKKTGLEDFVVGPEGAVKLKGHRNGNVVALKNASHFDDPEYLSKYPYFRQKAFALEIIFPGRVFKHIAGVDDDEGNLKIFESDFARTHHNAGECSLILFHLKSPSVTFTLSNGLSFYPPLFQSFPAVVLPLPSNQPSSSAVPYALPITFAPYDGSEAYSDGESPRGDNFYDGYGDDPDDE